MTIPLPWRRLAGVLALLAALGLGLRYVLPLLLPFVVGLAIALAAERPVRSLTAGGMRRGIASGLCVGSLLLLVASLLWLLLRRGFYELQALGQELPELLQALAAPMARLRQWLAELADRAPEGLGPALRSYLDAVFAAGPSVAGRASQAALGWVSDLAARLPGALLAAVTALVSSFFFSAELPELRRWLRRRMPAPWAQALRTAAGRVRQALGGWVQAQLKLMGITFAIVAAGLLLTGLDYALLLAAVIALVDALPVFGAGTVLLPWAVLFFLRGNPRCGFALIGIYAAAALARSVLEPRLVGRHMGLPPLLSLLSVYLGYRLFGLPGMILTPVAAMLALQFCAGGEATSTR